jgi:hypothetical protein
MVVRPDLDNPVLLQVLPGFVRRRFIVARDEIVPRFWRAGDIDGEGDELGHARDEPRFTCLPA